MTTEANLWQFALHTYQRTGVAERLLRWQDEQQISINLVLWLLWLEQKGVAATAALAQQGQEHIADWHREHTAPLRQMRRQLKAKGLNNPALADYYKQLKEAELAAEKVELQLLEKLVPSGGDKPLTPGTNLTPYLNSHKVDADQQQAFLVLVAQV
jgi:uncharacterized protein (TIGR02444 family)